MIDKIPEVTCTTVKPISFIKDTIELPSLSRTNEPFWFSHNNGASHAAFKKGILIGSYSEARCKTGSVFELFYESFKMVLREVSVTEDHQMSEFDNHIKLLKNTLDLIEEQIDNTLKSDSFGEELLAEMYGALIGYIDKNVKD